LDAGSANPLEGSRGPHAKRKVERLHSTFNEPVRTVPQPNDNVDLQLAWLHLVENEGCRLQPRRGVPSENVDTFGSHFHAKARIAHPF